MFQCLGLESDDMFQCLEFPDYIVDHVELLESELDGKFQCSESSELDGTFQCLVQLDLDCSEDHAE